jgi:telomerase reverse transcriptase
MFSVGDIYTRIKSFKAKVGVEQRPFYFAKLDVQAAFDSIPQPAMVKLMQKVMSQSQYQMAKHVEVQPGDHAQSAESRARPLRKWQTLAKTTKDQSTFAEMVEAQHALSKKSTVFIESVVRKSYDTRALTSLMETHVQENLVKIGKKFYRQRNGIPQGSILSSILCNYFYADLESTQLGFLLADEDCLLLRLIDDFLLVTTSRDKACHFVEIMYRGLPEYGVTVSKNKSLVNFDLTVGNDLVPRTGRGQGFPYCGLLIDCKSLDVIKNREKTTDPGMSKDGTRRLGITH